MLDHFRSRFGLLLMFMIRCTGCLSRLQECSKGSTLESSVACSPSPSSEHHHDDIPTPNPDVNPPTTPNYTLDPTLTHALIKTLGQDTFDINYSPGLRLVGYRTLRRRRRWTACMTATR